MGVIEHKISLLLLEEKICSPFLKPWSSSQCLPNSSAIDETSKKMLKCQIRQQTFTRMKPKVEPLFCLNIEGNYIEKYTMNQV